MPLPRSRQELSLEAYAHGSEALVVLRGRLVLENCEEARTRLHSISSSKIERFYIYLGHLDYIDSAGWGAMVGLKMANNRTRTRTLFVSPSDRIMDIFRISKLDSIFEILRGDEAEAIRRRLEQPEYALWRDANDAKVIRFGTEANMTPSAPVTPPLPAQGEHADRLTREAVECLRTGNYQRAIETYEKLLEINPDDISALNNLGVVFEKRAEWYDRAAATWRKVLEISERRKDLKHADRARKHLDSLERLRALG